MSKLSCLAVCGLAAVFTTAFVPAHAEGLRLTPSPSDTPVWPLWQARRTVLAAPSSALSLWARSGAAGYGEVPSAGSHLTLLVGDYFFERPGLSWWPSSGVLRASTGLVVSQQLGIGLRSPDATSIGPNASLPYVGLGYSGLSLRGGWSVSADLGLIAENPSGLSRAGRALFGSQGLDAALRELRLSPLLQVGVRYQF